MSKHFPKLAAKYGYKDSDWLDQKEREEKQARDEGAGAAIKRILLDGGIVTSSGKIPPFKIAAQVLKTGTSPKSDASRTSWQPIDLNEGHYWIAVSRLEKGSPAEHTARPDLRGVKLSVDVEAGDVRDFGEWMESLKGRGLA